MARVEKSADPISLLFHEVVRSEMHKQGLTAKLLADRLGMSHQAVTELLRKRNAVRPATIIQWLGALGFTVTLEIKDQEGRIRKE